MCIMLIMVYMVDKGKTIPLLCMVVGCPVGSDIKNWVDVTKVVIDTKYSDIYTSVDIIVMGYRSSKQMGYHEANSPFLAPVGFVLWHCNFGEFSHMLKQKVYIAMVTKLENLQVLCIFCNNNSLKCSCEIAVNPYRSPV